MAFLSITMTIYPFAPAPQALEEHTLLTFLYLDLFQSPLAHPRFRWFSVRRIDTEIDCETHAVGFLFRKTPASEIFLRNAVYALFI